MEDFSIRAIIIGVSLFVTMLTLSAILIYFNTARSIADEVSKRTDIADSYDYIMNSENSKDTLTGVEVRSLINKYAGVEHVKINIVAISGEAVSDNSYQNINNTWFKTFKNEYNEVAAKIIREDKLDVINPSWRNHVEKVEKNGQITLNVKLNVNESLGE